MWVIEAPKQDSREAGILREFAVILSAQARAGCNLTATEFIFFKLGFDAQYPPMTGKTKRVSPVGPVSEHNLANKRRGVSLRCNTANAVSKT